MKRNELKNCCNIDLDEIERLNMELSNLYDDNKLYQISKIFRVLGDPTRIQILYLLKSMDLYVCEIMAALDKPQPTTSHHLNVLKNAGFIGGHKEGIWTLYRLKRPEIVDLLDALFKPIESQ